MQGFKHDHMDSLNRYREYKKFWDRHRIPGEVKDKKMLWTDPGYQPMYLPKKKDKNGLYKIRSRSTSPEKHSRGNRKKIAKVATISIASNGISDVETKKAVLQNTNRSKLLSNEEESKQVKFRVPRMDHDKESKPENDIAKNTPKSNGVLPSESTTKDNNLMKIITDSATVSKRHVPNGRNDSSSSSSSSDSD